MRKTTIPIILKYILIARHPDPTNHLITFGRSLQPEITLRPIMWLFLINLQLLDLSS